MRIRTALAAVAAATLLAGLNAAPASAGTGSSTSCSDGVGYQEVPILTSPVTVGVEVAYPPGGPHQYLIVCYSTSAVGQPAQVTSGAIAVDIWTDTGTAQPGAYVGIGCYPDYATGVGPSCGFANSANVMPSNLAVEMPYVCLADLGGSCLAYVPGVRVVDRDPRPLLSIQVLSVPVNVGPPQCVAAVLAPCP